MFYVAVLLYFDVTVLIIALYCLLIRSANLLNIERVLLIAERYIISVEELHTAARSILPHGASFQGLPLTFNVICDAHKKEFPIQVLHEIVALLSAETYYFCHRLSKGVHNYDLECVYGYYRRTVTKLLAH